MKKIFLITCTSLAITAASAQNNHPFTLGIGPAFSLPAGGQNTNTLNMGIGADVKAEYKLNKHFSAFATGGYSHFFNNDKSIFIDGGQYQGSAVNYYQVLLGINYRHKSGFIAGVGVASAGVYGSFFAYTLQAGYSVGKFDIMVYYTNMALRAGLPTVGVKAYYNFLGGKR